MIAYTSVYGHTKEAALLLAGELEKAGWHTTKSAFVDAPLIDELPMALECELVSYDTETCAMVGRIVNVSVDERILGEDGLIDVDLLQPIVYDPCRRDYRAVGEKAGKAYGEGRRLMQD